MTKQGFQLNQVGESAGCLPSPNDKAELTGKFKIDYYGYWWEAKNPDNSKFWVIGEYPKE